MASPTNSSGTLRVSNGSSDPQVFNAGFTFTAGRQAVLIIAYYSDGQGLTAVNLGGTAATRIARSVPGSFNELVDIWFADDITGGNTTVSVDGGTVNYMALGVTEWAADTFTGVDTDTDNLASGSGTTASISTDAALSAAGVVFAGIICLGGGDGFTPSGPSGWTEVFQETSNDYAPGRGVWKEETTGVKTANFGISPSADSWLACIVALKLAEGGGGSDPTLTDVDTDETVLEGQTSVAVTGTNMGADDTERTFTLRQGSTSVPQTETGTGTDTAATLTIGIEQSGADIKFGSATLRVTRTADSEFADIAVTVNPPSGHVYVDVGTPNTEADYRIETDGDDLESGDQIWAYGTDGGAIPAGLHIETDGSFWFDEEETPTAFKARVWDASDATWGTEAVQSIAGDEIEAGVDALVITEQVAGVKLSRAVAASLDTLAITERTATVKVSRAVAAALDALTISEQAGTIKLSRSVQAAVDALVITEQQASAGVDGSVDIETGIDALSITEHPALVGVSRDIAAGSDALAIAEQAATLTLAKVIAASVRALVITERPSSITVGMAIQAAADSLVLTENAAAITFAAGVAAGVDSLLINEMAATVRLSRAVSAAVDSLVISEHEAVTSLGKLVFAAVESLQISGNVADIEAVAAILFEVSRRYVARAPNTHFVVRATQTRFTVH